MKRILKYKVNNVLSYSAYGDKNGSPILVQHGMVASIHNYRLFGPLIEAGKRVICIARPGYEESSPYPMKNMAEWGEIISVLVNELDIAQCDVLGISSGAPYSYAIGYQLPMKVHNIFIFSGIPALYDDRVLEVWPYPIQRNASIAEMKKVAREVFFPNITNEDRVSDDVRDSLMNDCFGIAQDLRIRCMDWGFALSDVKQAVYMVHSRTDGAVPLSTAERTVNLIPNCQLEIREGEHFSEEALGTFLVNTVLRQHDTEKVSR
jgi:pimeloyl-ACP methyl ester carboxylesterase